MTARTSERAGPGAAKPAVAPESALAALRSARYIQLTTFRKDGRAVATPVWLAFEGDTIVAFTEATSGKAKRIRNDGRVLIARCDGRGRAHGSVMEAHATLTDAAGTRRVLDEVRRRYGWQARLLHWLAERRTRDLDARQVGIVITLGGSDGR